MRARHLFAILFAGSVAACTAAGPAFPSCECDVVAKCRWFTLQWQDTCPTGAASGLEKDLNEVQKKQLLERMAHGVAFASQSWRLVQNNPDLRAALGAAPIALTKPEGKTSLVSVDAESLVARFRQADQTSVARLYTVRLGSYGSRQAAATALLKWKGAVAGVAVDSLPSVAWRYQSCAGAREANLFVLPPSASSSGQFELDFRLLIERADAEKIAGLLEPRLMTHVDVAEVTVTGSVLGAVLSQ